MNKIHEKLALVPSLPGIYMMKDASGHIIYVGKAKNLKNRLSSYFKSGSHDAKVTAMLEKVDIFDYFIVKTEKDALGLEANLIKKHKPHYNILLKDNKSFPYIKIVDGAFPYLEITRKLTKGGKYFGPYFNGIWAKELLSTIQDVFPVRTCTKPLKAQSTCMNFQIGRCSAPCSGKISKEDYALIVENVKSFLKGEKEFDARGTLQKKMETAAELQQFELAIRYRKGIELFDKLKERTITQVGRDVNCDVFGSASRGEIFVASVLTVRAGKLIGVQNFANENKAIQSDQEMLSGFIMQYYTENAVPDLIVAEHELDDVAEALGCEVFTPKAALKKQLLEMASANALEYIETSIEKIKYKNEFTLGACEELAEIVSGNKGICYKKIECYDISHYSGEDQVASMVVFIDGRAERKLYRKFKIKHKEGNNDYLSMQEVLTRRINRSGVGNTLNGTTAPDESFGTLPDLIIIDGGKGQLSSAMEVLKERGLIIDIISIAERNEEIFVPNKSEPIVLSRRSYALRLVQRIRDEAHRFAITYHKKLRSQTNLSKSK